MTADNIIVSGLEAPCPALEGAVRSHNGKLYHCNGREWTEQGGGSSSGPKVYRALLSQSGTDVPVATVLENTLGGVPVLGYVNPGRYSITLPGAFPFGKTFGRYLPDTYNGNPYYGFLAHIDGNSFRTYNFDLAGENVEAGAGEHQIEILVYP